MNRIYRGWIFNKRGGFYVATNSQKQTICAKDERWIMREIDRIEFEKMRREEEGEC